MQKPAEGAVIVIDSLFPSFSPLPGRSQPGRVLCSDHLGSIVYLWSAECVPKPEAKKPAAALWGWMVWPLAGSRRD